ncbi:glutamate/gamma-aminobutyrate family transporter YjeM [Ligilactobacillus aviarius]|uniref:glutamate/gamma-aminobutyrate family transporter YjeM n=1 Tax=Ligilactobacillus aviarius TaxID=1606 RepID=UPI0024BB5409|nr:glutamate/gamma-aminobutyrate family transporter YjeM [Ligilactobacillus aviarius]
MESSSKTKKIGLATLVMMIISSIYGFANTPRAFMQMGYASIIWYILAALVFFLPVSLMLAEYGSSFKEAKGGIYSWLEGSIGEKWAFVGTFIWLAAWIVWLVQTASSFCIPLSSVIFGKDTTSSWHLFGLSSVETLGVIGIVGVLIVTFFSSRGMDAIAKVSTVGGAFNLAVNGLFLIISILILVFNHGHLAQPVSGMSSFIHSPNAQFTTPIAMISFIVYAIFAYGGMETMGGIMDSLDEPEKTFPRGILFATAIIAVGYALTIFMWGFSTNWRHVFGGGQVTLGNVTYVLMGNLGVAFGNAIGVSHHTALLFGSLMTRFTGFSILLAVIGSFFIMTYSPIKSFIMGSDPDLWPEKVTKLNKAGMPAFAMWIQAIVVCVFIFFISFGGSAASKFFTILTNMSNVSTTFPYLFLVGAFPFFKKLKDIDRPFEFFKNKFWTNLIVALCLIVLLGGILFTIIQPILVHQYSTAFWTAIGPIFFGAVALVFYEVSSRKREKKN